MTKTNASLGLIITLVILAALGFNIWQTHAMQTRLDALAANLAPLTAAQQTPPSTAQSSPRQVAVNFFLAQKDQAEGLNQLTIDQQAYWVEPQPALARNDVRQVAGLETDDGTALLYFSFTDDGRQKLQDVTDKAKGKTLLIAVGGRVIGTLDIDHAISDGKLGVTTSSKDAADKLAQVIANGVQ